MKKQFRVEHTMYQSDRKPVDVMTFETFELGNDDIIDYIMEHYLKQNSELYKKAQELLDDEIMEYNQVRRFFEEALQEIAHATGKTVNYVVWLADEDSVREQYSKWYERDEMDIYDVSEAIVLSDLGYDGRLYGFCKEPSPIESIS